MPTLNPLITYILRIEYASAQILVGVHEGRVSDPSLDEASIRSWLVQVGGSGKAAPILDGRLIVLNDVTGRVVGGYGPFVVVAFTAPDGTQFFVVYGPGNTIVSPYLESLAEALDLAAEAYEEFYKVSPQQVHKL